MSNFPFMNTAAKQICGLFVLSGLMALSWCGTAHADIGSLTPLGTLTGTSSMGRGFLFQQHYFRQWKHRDRGFLTAGMS